MSKKLIRKTLKVVTNVDPLGIVPDKIENFVAPIVLSAINPAIGAAYTGAKNYADTGSLKGSLLKAGGSYVGGKLSANILGDLGTVGGTINSTLGTSIGESAANALPGALAAKAWGTPINSIVGSALGENLASSLSPQKTKAPLASSNVFTPTRQQEKEVPMSLRGAGYITPEQYSSGVASQGVYGGGVGNEESDYFLNLVNRRLIDDAGNVDSDLSEINPVENSYLAQLGLGGMSDARSLLEAISKRKAA